MRVLSKRFKFEPLLSLPYTISDVIFIIIEFLSVQNLVCLKMNCLREGGAERNELANFVFGSRIDAIKRILTDPTQFMVETLLAVGITFYVLMTITFGIAIPCGIFTPTVLIGAALGGAAGNLIENHIDPEITPSTFALLGVAALLAGVQRSTVSVAVILVEGTGQIRVLTPAIIVVVVARYGELEVFRWQEHA